MQIPLRSAGGRYPFGHYDRQNIRASLAVIGGQIRIRIDDIENIDRWEELVGDLADVRTLDTELHTRQEEQP